MQTSSDRFIWYTDAQYYYYLHGPLARVELGEYRSQGLDYAYTLQGWIKGVNKTFGVEPAAEDFNVGKDVFAYSLGYFENDYKAINDAEISTDERDHLWTRLDETVGHRGLYNGNISWMVTDLAKIGEVNNDRTKGMQAMLYKYDQLHRITQSRGLTGYSAASGFALGTGAYDETYSYDGNGNILTLDRMNDQGQVLHDYDFYYYKETNKLRGVLPITRDTLYNGAINSNAKLYRDITVAGTARPQSGTPSALRATRDITIQNNFEAEEGMDFAAYIPEDGPFVYDAIGNLIADEEEGAKISWTPYGKVRDVKTKNDSVVVRFKYDATGNRIEKRVEQFDTTRITRYVRDASGNVMAIYNDTTVTERPVYGSSRVGMYRGEVLEGDQMLGRRDYELGNHLGNVLSVITDNIGMTEGDSTWAYVVSTSDYYPFGLEMKERDWKDTTSLARRYGFNGKEKDDGGEWGNTNYNYGARIYDPKIGKFLSLDPQSFNYPGWSNYGFVKESPISRVDPSGKWDIEVHVYNDREKYGYGMAIVKNRHGEEVFRFRIRAEGTAGRNRTVKNSDTPLGTYEIPDNQAWITGGDRQSYGPNPRLNLDGKSGEISESGREDIRIHGGRQETYNQITKEWEADEVPVLKKTYGCMRCLDTDILELKSITDGLEANDDLEIPGKLTVFDDLVELDGQFLLDEHLDLDAELDKLNNQLIQDVQIQQMINELSIEPVDPAETQRPADLPPNSNTSTTPDTRNP